MKKMIISFCVMFVCLVSSVSVFAALETVSDSANLKISSTSYAWAYLTGRRDTRTDKLSNVETTKVQHGKATVKFIDFTRPSVFTAKATARFYNDGVKRFDTYLRI